MTWDTLPWISANGTGPCVLALSRLLSSLSPSIQQNPCQTQPGQRGTQGALEILLRHGNSGGRRAGRGMACEGALSENLGDRHNSLIFRSDLVTLQGNLLNRTCCTQGQSVLCRPWLCSCEYRAQLSSVEACNSIGMHRPLNGGVPGA